MEFPDILKNYKFGEEEEEGEGKFDLVNAQLNDLLEKYKMQVFPKHLSSSTTDAPQTQHDDLATTPSVKHDDLATTPSVKHDDLATAPSVKHDDLTTTPSVKHDDLATTPSVKHDDLTTTPSVKHDDLTTTQSSQRSLWDTLHILDKIEKEIWGKTAQPANLGPSTTEDYHTAIRRFWDSTDYNKMSEYLRSLEESMKQYNTLDSGRVDHYSPYFPPHLAQLTPAPPTPYRDHQPAVSHNWRDHRETPVVRHKHGLQTWHIVIMVVILVAAMVSYACKISSKRSSTPRRRRGTASSTPQEREPAANAPARDDLYAVVSVPRASTASHPPPNSRRADLQEVNVESIGFVLAEAAPPPPSRPDTPPPPYPGPPLRSRSELQEKPSDAPPPYHAAVKRPT